MTKAEELALINERQAFYVNELYQKIISTHPSDACMKEVNFTSPTGTGKTNMMAMLINLMPDVFFLVTTLSKGQLDKQIKRNLSTLCHQDNFVVYGVAQFKNNTKLTANEILAHIHNHDKVIWIRDEGHIHTNKWTKILSDEELSRGCWKIINFSATNKLEYGVVCNFVDTMMLRTVHQQEGTMQDAIEMLMKIKQSHKSVPHYNPCAIVRAVTPGTSATAESLCKQYGLKYINITDEDFDMSELCEDDNEYDVIINKLKIVEGIDVRRAHVLYVDNVPKNPATVIQVIGRTRRNALFWRDDIDIMNPSNERLLDQTRQCFVYYQNQDAASCTDETGELQLAFCPYISCELLKVNSEIKVKNGQLSNGLHVQELEGETGCYHIVQDPKTGFNRIAEKIPFYETERKSSALPQIFSIPNYTARDKTILDEVNATPGLSIKNRNVEVSWEYIQKHWSREVIGQEVYYQQKQPLDADAIRKLQSKTDGMIRSIVYRSVNVLDVQIADEAIEKITAQDVTTLADGTVTAFCPTLRYTTAQDAIQALVNDMLPSIYNTYTHGIVAAPIFAIQMRHLVHYTQQNHPHLSALENAVEQAQTGLRELIDELRDAPKRRKMTFNISLRPAYEASPLDKLFSGHRIRVKEEHIPTLGNTLQYRQISNDEESAIIGLDTFELQTSKYDDESTWYEDRSVNTKFSQMSKLHRYIMANYPEEIQQGRQEAARQHVAYGTNNMPYSKKCKIALSCCVEYYAKALLYGDSWIADCYEQSSKELKRTPGVTHDMIMVRACILKYREMMQQAFGENTKSLTLGVTELSKQENAGFIEDVVRYGTRAYEFIKEILYNGKQPNFKKMLLHDNNLSIQHISALCDIVTEDTIIDIKCTNYISETSIKQALAYHYLSTKRSDLRIKRILLYDAFSDKCVEIYITPENLAKHNVA